MSEQRETLDLDDLLSEHGIHTTRSRVLVMRHAPPEPDLRRALPWLAANKPEIYNAYQQAQRPKQEQQLRQAAYLVSCIGHSPRKALFVGVYLVAGFLAVTARDIFARADIQELKQLGMNFGSTEGTCLWFDLEEEVEFREWKGKLVFGWPPMERNWSRWADQNRFPIAAMLRQNLLLRGMRP